MKIIRIIRKTKIFLLIRHTKLRKSDKTFLTIPKNFNKSLKIHIEAFSTLYKIKGKRIYSVKNKLISNTLGQINSTEPIDHPYLESLKN